MKFPLCISLPDVYGIAQSISALASVIFVWYIFIYTKKKDAADAMRNLLIQEQNIRIQWFKDLIVQPNFASITKFYEELASVTLGLSVPGLSLNERRLINGEIKKLESVLRKSFVNLLGIADKAIENDIIKNLDLLIDGLTETIFNDGINLSHPPTFEKEISSLVYSSKNILISRLYSFQGTS